MNDTVHIVDDDSQARNGTVALLTSAGFNCRAYESAEAFLQSDGYSSPGCVVLDLSLRGMSGIGLQEKLLDGEAAVSVVVVSAYADPAATFLSMQMGSIAVLEKPFGSGELTEAVELGLHHSRVRWQTNQRYRWLSGKFRLLSEREINVLERIARGQPNKAIASKLSVGMRTVERTRETLVRKLGVQTAAEAVALAAELATLSSSFALHRPLALTKCRDAAKQRCTFPAIAARDDVMSLGAPMSGLTN